jgi:hypothetical protein
VDERRLIIERFARLNSIAKCDSTLLPGDVVIVEYSARSRSMTDDDPKSRSVRAAAGRAVPREGDIIVTAVGGHYAIGRLKADGDSQDYLQSQEDRAVALKQACALAGATRRVFLYPSAGTPGYLLIDCGDASIRRRPIDA